MAEGKEEIANHRTSRIDAEGISRFSKHPIWELLTKIAAPAAVIISAASYLAGFTYRATLLGSFGFDYNVIELSVQNTIALGYVPLAVSLVAIAAIMQMTIWLAVLASYPINLFIGNFYKGDMKKLAQKLTVTYRKLLLVNLYNAAAVTMFCAIIAGTFFGSLFASYYIGILNGGCQTSCVHVVTTRGHLNGLIIAQSKDTSLVVSKKAAYLLPNSSVLSVSPVDKRGWIPFEDS